MSDIIQVLIYTIDKICSCKEMQSLKKNKKINE